MPSFPLRPSRQELVHLYHTEDMSQREIARYFGCHQATVAGWMRQMAVASRRQKPAAEGPALEPAAAVERRELTPERRVRILELDALDWDWSAIARAVGLRRSLVERVLAGRSEERSSRLCATEAVSSGEQARVYRSPA